MHFPFLFSQGDPTAGILLRLTSFRNLVEMLLPVATHNLLSFQDRTGKVDLSVTTTYPEALHFSGISGFIVEFGHSYQISFPHGEYVAGDLLSV